MGFVIWYQVRLPGLRVSNDVYAGDFILDADLTIDLVSGPAAGSFSITLKNLPRPAVEALAAAQAAAPLTLTASLGYFDDPAGRAAVLEGTLEHLTSRVDDAGALKTVLTGQEKAGRALLARHVHVHREGVAPLEAFVADVAAQAGLGVAGPGGLGTVEDYTVTGTGMQALRTLADQAGAPLVIGDGTVRIGPAVGLGVPVRLVAGTHIIELQPVQQDRGTGLRLTVLGDPALKPGTPVVVVSPAAPPGPLRVERVQHSFSTRTGYTCDVTLVAAAPGEPATVTAADADAVAERIHRMGESAPPSIEVGQITGYASGHLASLDHGQKPDAKALTPSVHSPVERQTLHGKPIAAPFAFDDCGLIVPVYKGMRALLAHNKALVNDAVTAGFLWTGRPPRNQPGDWWLCLPTGLDARGKPTGKGVNDLTDGAGLRVVQAKGLRITVGERTLTQVGERPEPGDADVLVVEHASGTTVTIAADGSVTITTRGKDITIGTGGHAVKIGSAGVEVT
ncbi:hypothetical protein HII36_08785 [Nonomuraea sp. NN258]|uniref:hypothetical protein n=1 Tax=Nonomuraea antri TaxID=2730852 RepID=UPI0015690519|nr:hypothetical protein [Nonomuraea antri]NRQ31934.1 hypothetical protein [Nonomuraea antri]